MRLTIAGGAETPCRPEDNPGRLMDKLKTDDEKLQIYFQ
jgi:hypothetical protein